MTTEQSLQEQAFQVYLALEAEELKELCQELKLSAVSNSHIATILAVRDFINKRVVVIKEADALFKATKEAREKVTA